MNHKINSLLVSTKSWLSSCCYLSHFMSCDSFLSNFMSCDSFLSHFMSCDSFFNEISFFSSLNPPSFKSEKPSSKWEWEARWLKRIREVGKEVENEKLDENEKWGRKEREKWESTKRERGRQEEKVTLEWFSSPNSFSHLLFLLSLPLSLSFSLSLSLPLSLSFSLSLFLSLSFLIHRFQATFNYPHFRNFE